MSSKKSAASKAYYERNQERLIAQARLRREQKPDTATSILLKSRYGITLTEYEAQLALQNGVCAICKKPETFKQKGKVARLAVDHDHVTGRIRGLLCNRCNRALGLFGNSIEVLSAAANYVGVVEHLAAEERRWWAILVMASEAAQTGNMTAHDASIRARMVLVKQFGLNLDDIDIDAREEYLRLLMECEEKREKEQKLSDAVALLKATKYAPTTSDDKDIVARAEVAVNHAREMLGEGASEDQIEGLALKLMQEGTN